MLVHLTPSEQRFHCRIGRVNPHWLTPFGPGQRSGGMWVKQRYLTNGRLREVLVVGGVEKLYRSRMGASAWTSWMPVYWWPEVPRPLAKLGWEDGLL